MMWQLKMNWQSSLWRGLLVVAVAWSCSGCNNGADVVEVSGKLMRGGKPLPNFVVTFQPETGRPSMARTNDNGEFELVYTAEQKGAVRGKHKVYVRYEPMETSYNPKLTGAPSDLKAIVEKYGNASTTQCDENIEKPTKDLVVNLD